jgi:N-acetylglucosaminyldiphosphoundecaprenol N-acetyl-beta-D-mannosaminyltransferase
MMNETTAPKINICGTGISDVSLAETMDIFDEWIGAGVKKRVCVTPVNCVLWANKNKTLQDLYNTADLTLCDGVPLIWAASFLGRSLKGRVTGLDLLPMYIERSAAKGHTMFFLGAKEGVADFLKEQSEKKHPAVQITGTYSPPFAEKFSEEETAKMVALVNAVKPNILWVSLTAPKQDYWIHENIHKLDVNIAIGVGGAFEVAAGIIQRAPRLMQKAGLEWLFRLSKEPKRLFRRYLVEAPGFIPLVIRQKLKQRKRPF